MPLFKLVSTVEDDLANQCARAHNTIVREVLNLAACRRLPWDFDD
jgi:hypothetical protein